MGYAQITGIILGASYQQNNVFGTGNSVNVGVNHSRFQTSYNFSFFDPYYTVDGVSRGYSVFYRSSDYDERNIARFSTDSFGGSVNFGYPISEVSRVGMSVGYENTKIKEGVVPAQEISDFLDREGHKFNLITLSASYQMSALNRGLLPTGGRSQSISFEMSVPGSELEFYRINYNGQINFDPFQRWNNTKGAFRTTKKKRVPRDALIFIIDDTVTTGSSLLRAAEAVLHNYPKAEVHLLALAQEL